MKAAIFKINLVWFAFFVLGYFYCQTRCIQFLMVAIIQAFSAHLFIWPVQKKHYKWVKTVLLSIKRDIQKSNNQQETSHLYSFASCGDRKTETENWMVKRQSLTIVEIFSFSQELVENLSYLSIKRKQNTNNCTSSNGHLRQTPKEPTLEFPT